MSTGARAPREEFSPAGFFVLRTPLLPFEEVFAGDERNARRALDGAADLERAIAADREHWRARLRRALERPEVREAIFLASPDLDERIDDWRQPLEEQKGRRIELALARYWIRMAGRPTPFGLFAGCTVGSTGDETMLKLMERNRYRRHTRFDSDFLFATLAHIENDPALVKSLSYRPNSSLYPVGDKLRYAESRRRGEVCSHHLVAVEATDYIRTVLESAAGGATVNDLARAVVSFDPEIDNEEAEAFVEQLIENQVLVSNISPAVTGPEPVHELVSTLKRCESVAWIGDRLAQVQTAFEGWDGQGLGIDPRRYRAVVASLEELPAPVHAARLFQVDLVKPGADVRLGPEVVEDVSRGVRLLHRLHGKAFEQGLSQFRAAFLERYDSREVPLVEALDEEAGLPFQLMNQIAGDGSPLLRGLQLPPRDDADSKHWGPFERLRFRKLADALSRGSRELVLTEDDLATIGTGHMVPLPQAFSVEFTLCAASESAIALGDYRVLIGGVLGPSGARLLGRFCHADPELTQRIAAHLEADEAHDPDALYAEIVHLPAGRVGNVILRPVLRGYEIPYLGRSGVPPERQIPVTDLMLSVVGNRFVLRSERLGRVIIPRLTSAHDFVYGSLPIYRFLSAIQGQATNPWMTWSWGILQEVPFLPRVASGRVVLSRARWQIGEKTLQRLHEARGAERYRRFQAWREESGIDRHVLVADGDNKLPLDLDSELAVDVFVELTGRRSSAALDEMLPGPDELCVRGPEGRFAHEIIMPFERRPEERSARVARPTCTATRRFVPGSEWLYAKLYASPSNIDRILREFVRPFSRKVVQDGDSDRWFFMRYPDPDWHVRLRFHGKPDVLGGRLLPALHAAVRPFVDNGLVWRLQFDTYEREMERYGGDAGIECSERLFCADSEAVLEILACVSGDGEADARWRAALVGIDRLLADFGSDPRAQREILGRLREAFRSEFRVDKTLHVQLGSKFRKEHPSIDRLLSPDGADSGLPSEVHEALRRRSDRLFPVVAALDEERKTGRLTLAIPELLDSYIHMHVNRLLRSEHRAHELVLYDFLDRYYGSRDKRRAKPA